MDYQVCQRNSLAWRLEQQGLLLPDGLGLGPCYDLGNYLHLFLLNFFINNMRVIIVPYLIARLWGLNELRLVKYL